MYVTMNRFKIAHGAEEGFEQLWRERDSHLGDVPGFKSFSLMKGPVSDDHILYVSHSSWESREAFEAWTKSEAFRQAHKQAGAAKGTYVGPPVLEMFETVLSE